MADQLLAAGGRVVGWGLPIPPAIDPGIAEQTRTGSRQHWAVSFRQSRSWRPPARARSRKRWVDGRRDGQELVGSFSRRIQHRACPVGEDASVTTPQWQPFGLNDEEVTAYDVLVDGVPAWLEDGVIRWLLRHLVDSSGWPRQALCIEIQTACRLDVGARAGRLLRAEDLIHNLRRLEALTLLQVVDYVLGTRPLASRAHEAQLLESVLISGRSKWTVGDRMGRTGLVERVPAGVQDSVEGVIASAAQAGQQLARAWVYLHGLKPEPSEAYAWAVRAVETAAIAVVQPKKHDATLGTVLGQMRADGDWGLPLREHQNAPGPDLLLSMLQTLWTGHRDRHGNPHYADVGYTEARAAVMLSATLTDWFASGVVSRPSRDRS
jgi:hypothetical protein